MKDAEVEYRYFNINNEDNLEFRDDSLEVSGYGIVFDTESRLMGDFVEIIENRALNEVDMSDVLLLSQHKMDDVLARTDSGTMALSVTDKGVHFRANLPDTTLGRDTYTLIKRGDLKDMSFGFTVAEDTWNTTTTPYVRSVQKIGQLVELSIVTRGAYKQPNVSHRSLEFKVKCIECKKGDDIFNEMKSIYNEMKKD